MLKCSEGHSLCMSRRWQLRHLKCQCVTYLLAWSHVPSDVLVPASGQRCG